VSVGSGVWTETRSTARHSAHLHDSRARHFADRRIAVATVPDKQKWASSSRTCGGEARTPRVAQKKFAAPACSRLVASLPHRWLFNKAANRVFRMVDVNGDGKLEVSKGTLRSY
jgi:hypothetical protein